MEGARGRGKEKRNENGGRGMCDENGRHERFHAI